MRYSGRSFNEYNIFTDSNTKNQLNPEVSLGFHGPKALIRALYCWRL